MIYFIIFNYLNNNINLDKLINIYKLNDYKIIPIDKKSLTSICRMMDIYGILDNDFIILINGKYKLITPNNTLLESYIKSLELNQDIDIICRYFFIDYIGLKCKYIKMINGEFNEINVEIMKNRLNIKNIIYLNNVGIDINLNKNINYSPYTIY